MNMEITITLRISRNLGTKVRIRVNAILVTEIDKFVYLFGK
jgi:hypothetical protein